MSMSESAAELAYQRWSNSTLEQREANARRMRLGIVRKELGRHDLDPAIQERIVAVVCEQAQAGRLTESQDRRLIEALFPGGEAA